MKKIPFDLEKAKAGAKIVTRDGKSVRIICWDYKCKNYPIVALVYLNNDNMESVNTYTENGKRYYENIENAHDLFILEEPILHPYKNTEEMDAAVKKHGSFVKNVFGRRLTITGYDDYGLSVGIGKTINYRMFLETYKWLDDSPCGIEV